MARFQHATEISPNNLVQIPSDKWDNLDPVSTNQFMRLTGDRSTNQGFNPLRPKTQDLTGRNLIWEQTFATGDDLLAICFNQMNLRRRVEHRGNAFIPIRKCRLHNFKNFSFAFVPI
jgi:hypothetical protein